MYRNTQLIIKKLCKEEAKFLKNNCKVFGETAFGKDSGLRQKQDI